MTKKITGTWIEFEHHNKSEGKPWDTICKIYSEEEWRKLIKRMKNDGMEYLVLLATALDNKAYFETDIYAQSDISCKNPLEVLLSEADNNDMKVFLSAGYYGNWLEPEKNMISADVTNTAFKAMNEICEKYGHHKSIYGWYLPDETCVNGYYSDDFINYINKYSKFMRELNKDYKMLVAPYGTNLLKTDDNFIKQLENIDADFIAYQDEVGVRKSTPEQTGAFYENLKIAHDKAGRSKLWADVELFDFSGEVYKSELIPAPLERINKQLAAISEYVEKILCYQYQVFLPEIKDL